MKIPREVLTLAFLLAVLCLAVSLTVEDEGSDLSPFSAAQKRNGGGGRRIPRDRVKSGYLFGKRSQWSDGESTGLLKTLAGTALSVHEFSQAIQQDPELANHVARHLDRDGDGYVSVSELL